MKRAAFLVIFGASMAQAQVLSLPSNAVMATNIVRPADLYHAPVGIYENGAVPFIEVAGDVSRKVWVITATGLTTSQIVAPLRGQLRDAGFDILLDCAAERCGGFDFRFGTEVAPAPEMYVDLGAYRFLTGVNEAGEAVTLLVSRSSRAAFIQIIQAGGDQGITAQQAQIAQPLRQDVPAVGSDFADRLDQIGRIVLSDLTFETGSADLSEGRFVSLDAVAAYLSNNSARRVALVGHTDAEGGLEGNIALSRRRAASVLERLVSQHGANRSQMEAQGVGYLSPLASNLTRDGQALNRRVEVIVISTSQ